MTSVPVLIVGAGPTGLALAVWLARFGVPFRVIDKAAEPGTTSRAMGVHARTLEFYRQLGFAEQVVGRGIRVAGVNLWGRGRKAARIPLTDIGTGLSPYPFLLDFPQDLHERLLSDHLRALGVTVERATELTGYDVQPGGVRVTLRHAGGTTETCQAEYLIGCDGAKSAVRKGLHGGFAGGTYEGLFYVADVEASGPPIDEELHVDLDDGDFLGIFPYTEKGRVRLIGAVRQLPAGRSHEQLTFEDVRGRALEHLRVEVRKVNWFSTYHVHHRVAEHFRCGRVLLAGDAAHIHSPVGAQGMNTGIGDATNLAWKLATVLAGRATDALLDTYETERIGFARKLVHTTDRAFTLVTRTGWLAEFVRLRIVPRVLPLLVRFGAFRQFAFRTVSQIGIHYRSSALSEGAAGGVRGGDRLPWVETVGGDNFEPLKSLDWQVHVYGEAAPGIAEACAELRLPLHRFDWSAAARRAGLRRGAAYLLRPDGYVALAAGSEAANRLREYRQRRSWLLGDLTR